ncbi:maltokinase N-terminal cap-like domain-containing protein [Auraticoccus monumenti]|uniref:Maltokinase n=1 Tax=Auraticoccus monumenti TaxID=675864 RepID=A0A1G7B3C5_9ACTN|nr:phosphotransferase [Auraticoccus monumenti]SDE20766.1 maltokinase [Auraticoccus monumenti]
MSADLLDHISRARWFGGKGRGAELRRVDPLPWLTPPGSWPAVRAEIAEVGYDDDTVEQYQLLLSYRPLGDGSAETSRLGEDDLPQLGRVHRHDATRDPEAMAAVLRAVVEEREVSADGAVVRCRTVAPHPLDAALAPRLFGGEQSNSSVMYGEVAMLKAFRRLEPGRNLDIEVHRALAGDPRARAARLHGWIEAEWTTGSRRHDADLAMVVEQLHDARDGWDLALASCSEDTDFTAEATALGVALRGVHEALAEHFPTGELAGDALAQTMARRLHTAQREAPELAAMSGELRSVFDRVRPLAPATQRVHGDFHLGQTLLTSDGWKIIDFEGEPMKTMDERREPDSPWRDVAGLLRSFDYAAGSAAAAAAASAELAGDAAAAARSAHAWAAACTGAFLAGYTGGTALAGGETSLLAAYVADKAVYEVVYEVRNRPAWVGIPLRALERLVDTDEERGDTAPEHHAPENREDR